MFSAVRDARLLWLYGGVVCLLIICSIVGNILKSRRTTDARRTTIDTLNARIRAWWKMCGIFTLSILIGHIASLVLFALISFLAMREYMTLMPTRRGDHRTLFWSFFVIMPLQYYLVGMQWYIFFSVMIPIFVFAFVPTSIAIEGDTEHFMERASKVQSGIMICAYCLSHAPALLFLDIPGFVGHNARLLLYLVIVVQMSDALQYLWGKLIGKHKIAWRVSPNKTWEGFIGGIASATALGTALWWVTPFTPLQSAGISLVICLMGFSGGLVMSAIKRDIGIKDFGVVVEGRGGILDSIDSFCFAAPIFFQLVHYYFVR